MTTQRSHSERAASDTKLTEQDIERLIPEFYRRVRADPVLGGIFDSVIDDWPDHLRKLQNFWHSIMFTSGRYNGQPMVAHIRHADHMTSQHFNRWLDIWQGATDELLDAESAAALQTKAARIAESLQLGVNFHRERSLRT